MAKKQALSKAKKERLVREVQFFQKHVVENKSVVKSAAEMGIHKRTCFNMKKTENYRHMALAHLEDSSLGGVNGLMGRLIKALDAQRPHTLEHKVKDKKGNVTTKQEVIWVADNNTQDKALKKVIDIYGLNAPQKKDVNISVSVSSDAELFDEIDQAQRSCGFVDQYEEREGSFELATDPQRGSGGDFATRKRTLLQGTSVPVES